MQPREVAGGGFSDLADPSIRVYALNRNELVLDRQEVSRLIEQRKFTIRRLTELDDGLPDQPTDPDEIRLRNVLQDVLSHEMAALNRLKNPSQSFSLLASQLIDEFIEELTG